MISEQLLTALFSAFAMGFLGSTHCIGMCGGLTVALNTGTAKEKSLRLSFTYQIFRVLSYGILGALVGGFGYLFSKWTNFPVLIVLGGIMLIMMGFYLLSWQNLLVYFEKLGRRLWKKVSPVQSRFLPIKRFHQAAVVGLLWGLLPCGLVYSALAMASTSGTAMGGFTSMVAFGLGTLPAMFAVGVFSNKLVNFFRNQKVRAIFGLLFILWGSFFIYQAVIKISNGQDGHQHHQMQTKINHSHH
ncbi:sulfite exporter TauE/SafE family protein [Kangiella profundi]|uniref:Sulfite exporter TauE/SafE family protein n=1 Tax=Kangiella profundi TaxID=1561924 RepID=A0A2K9ACP2_9GAMM|nr:sulfite exporter TauE/SafE family protein [Kangiella profundi]AUD78156.1 sulfite exporter TauE/SafE family protein [Kangiella profundi]GGF05565.1 cytochrome biogenesis protein [Kangiella profundi]